MVELTGPCAVTFGQLRQYVYVQGNDVGTCHVALSFGSAATSSVDVDFKSEWQALGDDPHGCGPFVVVSNLDARYQLSIPDGFCDAGDAGP
jgi:hypothetical protein